jgi:MoxR-like ATPase
MTIFSSSDATHRALLDQGYITSPENSNLIFLAANLNRPIILEGPAGGGKTQLARSVAAAAGMELISLQCYSGISDKDAIGHYNHALQELYVSLMGKGEGDADWDEIKKIITSRDFFISGPFLTALESERRCVLLIDEIDKVDYPFEAMLLEILAIWQMSVPGLGVIKAKHPPFTVITSNAERPLGFALRRRGFFLEIGHPTPEAEATIVANKTPDLPAELHRFIAGFAQALRAYQMEKAPSISEMTDLAMALNLMGKKTVLPSDRDLLLPLLAKTIGDRKRLCMKECFENIVRKANERAGVMTLEEASAELRALTKQTSANETVQAA